jgi:hypothetical protein
LPYVCPNPEANGSYLLRAIETEADEITHARLAINRGRGQFKHILVGYSIAECCFQDELSFLSRVALRTTPRDSTGIPHILEHLSLCGSAKYPVRDPFFKMLTRSLSTFMNAFTGIYTSMHLTI